MQIFHWSNMCPVDGLSSLAFIKGKPDFKGRHNPTVFIVFGLKIMIIVCLKTLLNERPMLVG